MLVVDIIVLSIHFEVVDYLWTKNSVFVDRLSINLLIVRALVKNSNSAKFLTHPMLS